MPFPAPGAFRRLPRGLRRRAAALAAVLLVQSVAALFFLGDVLGDLRWLGLNRHTNYEALVAVALLLGTGFGALEMHRTLRRAGTAERAGTAASAAFATLIDTRFDEWGLTPAERDVALFALKGLDTAEIARLRGSAEGTVRAQLARIYAKSGSGNRAQLVAQFVEDLLATPLTEAAPDQPQVG